MARKKRSSKRRSKSGTTCKRTHYKGHTRTICRSKRTGKIVGSKGRKTTKRRRKASTKKRGKASCPKRWRGLSVRRVKGGRCQVTLKSGRKRFVKKSA